VLCQCAVQAYLLTVLHSIPCKVSGT
jgi:hypothetical protein